MQIWVVSSDGKVFPVGFKGGSEEVDPLPNVSADILEKVLKWAGYYKDNPTPPEGEADEEFLQVSLAIISTSN